MLYCFFFFQAEDGIRDVAVTGVQTCALPIAQSPHEAVGPEAGAAGDLGKPAGADPAVEVELPEAVLSVAEALGEPQIVPGLGVDVRNSPAVAADLDRTLEALEPQMPLGPRKRPAKELMPQPSRGGPRERGEHRAGEAESLC